MTDPCGARRYPADMDEQNTAQGAQTEDSANSNIENQKVIDAEAVLRKNQELLGELKKLREKTREFEGFDFEKAKTALEEQQRLEHERLAKKGEFDKLLEQNKLAYEQRLEKEKTENERLKNTVKQEKLALTLIEKGVLPDRVNYLVKELADQVELHTTDSGFVLRKQNGIGDADEFNAMVEEFKAKSPFFFAAQVSSGTGGSGSQSTATATGNGRTMSKSEFRKLSVTEKYALAKSGVTLTED
jgi:hypothetical protein